nr:hypothetical protein [Candidatus Njordarchaeum guaymaensis]
MSRSDPPPLERSHIKKVALVSVAVIALILISIALSQMPQPRSVQRTEAQETPPMMPPQQPPSQTPDLTGNEEERIRDMIKAYYEAFNRHSESDQMAFFTNNVTVFINHGRDYSYNGPKEKMKSYLTLAFQLDPEVALTDLHITRLNLRGNEAAVECEYVVSSKAYKFSKPVTEYIELVKTNDVWKIAKTDIVF